MSADFTGFAGLHADLDGVLLRGSLAVVYFFVGKALLAAGTGNAAAQWYKDAIAALDRYGLTNE